VRPGEVLTVSVDVTNSGPYDAKETVLLFLTDVYREITPEVKRVLLSFIFPPWEGR